MLSLDSGDEVAPGMGGKGGDTVVLVFSVGGPPEAKSTVVGVLELGIEEPVAPTEL